MLCALCRHTLHLPHTDTHRERERERESRRRRRKPPSALLGDRPVILGLGEQTDRLLAVVIFLILTFTSLDEETAGR